MMPYPFDQSMSLVCDVEVEFPDQIKLFPEAIAEDVPTLYPSGIAVG